MECICYKLSDKLRTRRPGVRIPQGVPNQEPTLDAVGVQPTASVVSRDFDP